ncbi:MAG: type III-A CRISPR-associated protein Csm2 [Pirellulaceae bacterium]|jgi:CRISPR-associated protein Csm2|uniref:type III-A CRISPR-associated protein Csm2 n=1 Tax=Caldilinea sp. TaxID=2293560 RepID=UPI0021DD4A84|nr:type III-A CRISPR-associated protein Csm2 [uncultured Caldilinea sp.]GIW89769.1 MAG: type III-A CRISPR-associated protein Csm2 [Pirellulaceae bacterium]
MPNLSSNDLQRIITDPDAAQLLVERADQIGKTLKEINLTTSQIRALFGEVRQIQAQWSMEKPEQQQKALRRFILLKPKMAYRAKRERGRAVQELVNVLDPAIDFVVKEKDPARCKDNFQRFVDFFEAILAYHKAYGGN